MFTRPRQRITSDEEERRRAGFRIVTSYRFTDHGDRPGRLDAVVADQGGETLARLSYGDSALIQRTNLGPTQQPQNEPDGFWLDPVTGTWLSAAQAGAAAPQPDGDGDDDGPAGQRVRVIPYVRDRRNILVFTLAEPVELETALSVMYALERGIEAAFQLEDAELDSELLPPDAARATGSCSPSPPRAAPASCAACRPSRTLSPGRPRRRCGSRTSTPGQVPTCGGPSSPTARSATPASEAATTACSATATSSSMA